MNRSEQVIDRTSEQTASFHGRLEGILKKAGAKDVAVIPLGALVKGSKPNSAYGLVGVKRELDKVRRLMEAGGFTFVKRDDAVSAGKFTDVYQVAGT